jgi:tRNA nucleotidyltransferase (CCA-adding enzyme)
MKKISKNKILKEVLKEINPPKEDLRTINEKIKRINEEIKKELIKKKISAEIFIGGSYAKKTLIKKGVYDIDLFLRFDEKYKKENISEISERILKDINMDYVKIHGSRDYFKLNVSDFFFIELIPVLKIRNPYKSENITDLSYFHVSYIKKKIKNKKILDEIKLAKAFCYAQNCYGAESYINGFSGYAIELLIYYYKTFDNFLKKMIKINEDKKEVIDIEKSYKNKSEILIKLNSSKLQSPIILIDPTFKERNALAALSYETFSKFKNKAKEFLKNPKKEFFIKENINFEKIKQESLKKGFDFLIIKIETDKQEGDIAGTKMKKFFNYLKNEISKFYFIKNNGFEYKEGKESKCFFSVKAKKEIIFNGPSIKDKENYERFKMKHKNIFIKKNKAYAKEIFNKKIKDFLKEFVSINSQKILEMGIININYE